MLSPLDNQIYKPNNFASIAAFLQKHKAVHAIF